MVDVIMIDDTKYLSEKNDNFDELTPEERKMFEEAHTRLEEERKAGIKPSRVRQRLHEIWKMESDYFNSHPEAIRSANDDSEDK